ncbi:MAG: hypothetical protein H7A37_03125 [Chlamydiales bacterium]|nr:hypothetical protein [Chlamydiia bacterium]MCP5507279.1 hypothetical protein [Chlamydiales bacterium]
MDIEDFLTNEYLKKDERFGDDQFARINYLIHLAENMILSGRDPRVKVDSQNRAIQILAEVANGKDKLDEIVVRERDERRSIETAPGTFKTSASLQKQTEGESEQLLTNKS